MRRPGTGRAARADRAPCGRRSRACPCTWSRCCSGRGNLVRVREASAWVVIRQWSVVSAQ
eukprot:scaffold46293_cov70-Phaeocystis_antarctica.AAC.2